MNDSDEDADAEKRLQQRMEAAGSTNPPNPALLAPAALYLTSILEYVPFFLVPSFLYPRMASTSIQGSPAPLFHVPGVPEDEMLLSSVSTDWAAYTPRGRSVARTDGTEHDDIWRWVLLRLVSWCYVEIKSNV